MGFGKRLLGALALAVMVTMTVTTGHAATVIAGGEAFTLGTINVSLPVDPGTYVLDAINADAPDANIMGIHRIKPRTLTNHLRFERISRPSFQTSADSRGSPDPP